MSFTDFLSGSGNLIEIGKMIILIIVGILLGFVSKHLLRKGIDNQLLKKLFRKDINTYETSLLITKILTEVLQWIIILIFLNISLMSFNFNFISNVTNFIIAEIPKIVIFLIILSVGIIFSKIVSSYIKNNDIEKKEEISLIAEIIIVSAFMLSAFEYIEIKATALIELYKAILYTLGAIIVIFFIKYELFNKNKKK